MTQSATTGRAFVFGDNIDTDVLAPGSLMKLSPEALATHCLEAVDPDFARTVRPGDLLVAGANFGLGSSREQAAVSLKILGVRAVLATSFARIFWRNAINLGLPALVFPQAGEVRAQDLLSLNIQDGCLENLDQNRSYAIQPLPSHLLTMIADGGLIPHLKRRLQGSDA
ncbi:3-isopropylmalate dehydratase [Phenylobacterium sp.]|jgi:3-isopropylmalate/(R)-2-methylmalate dehydratase small subunit|uniref:LeuD/DmdB family oxidoreductase small subunit n=1 Tax=Phenylobacterium sp. TaxID=1871053 RepID=UPI0037CCAA2B